MAWLLFPRLNDFSIPMHLPPFNSVYQIMFMHYVGKRKKETRIKAAEKSEKERNFGKARKT
jgi:hypothetical protein